MTDEELKNKLLMFSGPFGWHRNPEGPQAVARIEKLEACARIEELEACARIEELEAWKLAVDHLLVSSGCNTADSYSTPAKALDALIKQEIALANDPLINGGTEDHAR